MASLRDPLTAVFLHIGNSPFPAALLVRSIRKFNPKARIL